MKKSPYSELFWYAFSRIPTEYGETRVTRNTDIFHAVALLERIPCRLSMSWVS